KVEGSAGRVRSAVSFQRSAFGVIFVTSPRFAEKLQTNTLCSVSTPLRWEELEGDIDPRQFTMEAVLRRLTNYAPLITRESDSNCHLTGASKFNPLSILTPDGSSDTHS